MAFVLVVSGHVPSTCAAGAIKVGIATCYTGPPGKYGKEATNAFEMAAKEINGAGGVLGRTIEFTTRDTKFKADISLTMAKELVMAEKVDVLVGTISSAAALAISGYAKAEKVPFIAWIAGTERLTGELGHRYVFAILPNTIMFARSLAKSDAARPYTKYWICASDYEYGHVMAERYWSAMKALKPEVEKVGESWFKTGEPDLAPYLTAILAAKPESLIMITGGADITNFMKAAKTIGFAERIPVSVPLLGHSMFAPLGLEAPEGIRGNLHYFWYYPDIPSNKAFVKKYRDAYGAYPGFPAFNGYVTARFIAEAFKRAGSVDTEKFIDALEGLEIDSPIGKIAIRAYDHQAIVPIHVGVTKRVPEYDFLIMSDLVTAPGEEIMPTIEEIKKARGEQ